MKKQSTTSRIHEHLGSEHRGHHKESMKKRTHESEGMEHKSHHSSKHAVKSDDHHHHHKMAHHHHSEMKKHIDHLHKIAKKGHKDKK